MDNQKPAYLSKTVWLNLVMALAAFSPQALAYISANPEVTVLAFGVVNIVLRLISKDKLTLS